MINFYFKGLSYPRFTVSEIIKIANAKNFDLIFISNRLTSINKVLIK